MKKRPSSEILSAETMLRYVRWLETADAIIKSMERPIACKNVTYYARLMDGATQVSCSGFGQVMIYHT